MNTLHDVRETLRAYSNDRFMLPVNWKAVCGEMADIIDQFQPAFAATRVTRNFEYREEDNKFAGTYELTRELVHKILERASCYPWTLQGFGMFRLNLGKLGRIHIWNTDYAVKNVSVIHTHPWNLHSMILSGKLTNVIYREQAHGINAHWRSEIQTGEGGGLKGDPVAVTLGVHQLETYGAGQWYWQSANEIHESRPANGTVTVVRRPKGPPDEKALVYWPLGYEWVSAEPRPVTADIINLVAKHALSMWEG